jgi:hypothetical protein
MEEDVDGMDRLSDDEARSSDRLDGIRYRLADTWVFQLLPLLHVNTTYLTLP